MHYPVNTNDFLPNDSMCLPVPTRLLFCLSQSVDKFIFSSHIEYSENHLIYLPWNGKRHSIESFNAQIGPLAVKQKN